MGDFALLVGLHGSAATHAGAGSWAHGLRQVGKWQKPMRSGDLAQVPIEAVTGRCRRRCGSKRHLWDSNPRGETPSA